MKLSLNPQQEKAAHHIEGPMLVLAGAGSGKTRIVTARVAHLLELGVPAQEILAVTFTNKAAEEMQSRIQRLSQASVLACTFHSLGARILRENINALGYEPDFTIYDEEDSYKLLKECLTALHLKLEKGEVKTLRGDISHAKNALVLPEKYPKEDPLTAQVYQLYQEKLKSYNAVDFDDLLYLPVRLFQEHPDRLEMYQKRWSFLLIDEYQDTNHAQYLLARLLSSKHNNLFAVGDPDQSIYSWRGADVSNILNFEKDYPGAQVVTLEQNYRSRNTILKAANELIHYNSSPYQKNLWSERGEGEKIGLYISDSDREETAFVLKRLLHHHEKENIPLNDCVIFYRTNFQSRVFEDALLKHNIPYVIVGGLSFYQRREIKDILALLRIVLGGADFLALARTINLPKRGIGNVSLSKLMDLSEENGTTIFTTCELIAEEKIPSPLSKKQLSGLKDYVHTIQQLKNRVSAQLPLHAVISDAIDLSHYISVLKEDPETLDDRRANLDELISKAAEWEEDHANPSLALFLEELSLRTTADEKPAFEDTVRLMTLHNGKGLEFSVVFLVGMEEDLFPHLNTKEDPAALEEERRLCYVGMTRAKDYLYLSAAKSRFLWGGHRFMYPSRFLKETPQELLYSYHTTWSEEPPEEEAEPGSFSPGTAVMHKDFGSGIIKKAYQTSLGLTYDVLFPLTGATRTLVAKYAKLKQVKD